MSVKRPPSGSLLYNFRKAGKSVLLGAAVISCCGCRPAQHLERPQAKPIAATRDEAPDPALRKLPDTVQRIARNADVVIIDTAGRLGQQGDLMEELSKINRVIKKVMLRPHEVLLVLDGSTARNAIEQARQFTAATHVSALAITKLDGTAKGGVVLAIANQFKIPVKFIGVGEKMEDLLVLDKHEFVDSLFSLEK